MTLFIQRTKAKVGRHTSKSALSSPGPSQPQLPHPWSGNALPSTAVKADARWTFSKRWFPEVDTWKLRNAGFVKLTQSRHLINAGFVKLINKRYLINGSAETPAGSLGLRGQFSWKFLFFLEESLSSFCCCCFYYCFWGGVFLFWGFCFCFCETESEKWKSEVSSTTRHSVAAEWEETVERTKQSQRRVNTAREI